MPISYVQSASAALNGSSVGLAYGSNNSPGNMLVVCVGVWASFTEFGDPTVSDTNGNKWVRVTNTPLVDNLQNVTAAYMFVAYNCKGGPNSVQASSGVSGFMHLYVAEYSGCAIASARDQAWGVGSLSAPVNFNSGSITTQSPNEVLVSFGFQAPNSVALSGSAAWTKRQSTLQSHGLNGSSVGALWDQIVSVKGSYNNIISQAGNTHVIIASFSDTSSDDYLVQAAQTRAAASSASVTFPAPNALGNTLILAISRTAGAVGTITSISDTLGNIWTLIGQTNTTTGGGRQSQLHLYACNQCKSGSNTATVNLSVTDTLGVIVAEYRNVTIGSSVQASNIGPSAISISGIGVTASPKPALVISLAFDQTDLGGALYTDTVASGWKLRMANSTGHGTIALSDQIIFSTQVIGQAITINSALGNGLHLIVGLANSLFPAGGTFIPDLQLQLGPATQLYNHYIPSSEIEVFENVAEGRTSIVLDFNNGDGVYARDLGCAFGWPTNSTLEIYVFQPSIIPTPEGIYERGTDWDDGGSPGAKFIQGVIIEAFSFSNAKTFFLQDSETMTLHPLNECPVVFPRQSVMAFSCTPFVAHNVRVIAQDGVEWMVWRAQLVFVPYPEATENWQTEMTSLGMTGWAHAREMNLAYLATAPVTLTLTFDSIPPIVLTLPSTGGVQNKTKVTLPPNKWKLIGFQASSVNAFRVFQGDIEVKLREWGAQGPYGILKPFGGKSAAGAAV